MCPKMGIPSGGSFVDLFLEVDEEEEEEEEEEDKEDDEVTEDEESDNVEER